MDYQTMKTNAIVLKEKELGETDKIFTLYTKNFGKFEVMGKGIRKIKAKLKFGLQGLNNVSLEFIRGKNFFIATDVFLKNGFWSLKREIRKYRAGLYVCDITDRLITGEEKDEEIWELHFETLEIINILPSVNYQLSMAVRYFEWNLLSFLGFEPELYHCIICQNKLSGGKFYFSAKEGGIVCNKCQMSSRAKRGKAENKAGSHRSLNADLNENEAGREIKTNYLSSAKCQKISRDAIKILRLIILKDKNTLKRLKINPFQERELKDLSKYYLSWILEEENFVI